MQNGSILLVDDEEQILISVKREISPWLRTKNLELKTARTGNEALELVHEFHDLIKVVITDIRMPSMKGSDLVGRIYSQYPEIACILLSAYTDADEISKSINSRICSYIVKPWETDTLIREIEKGLQVNQQRSLSRQDREKLQQLSVAGEMQRKLFGNNLPVSDMIDIEIVYEPAGISECSGDYYEVFELGGHRFLFLLGDVSGHGYPAALIGAMQKSIVRHEYVRHYENSEISPAGLLEWLNNRLHVEFRNLPDVYVPFTAALVDFKFRRLTIANAGHTPVYHIRGSVLDKLHPEGQPIGLQMHARYAEIARDIMPGDQVLMFTDGLLPGRQKSLNQIEQGIVYLHNTRNFARTLKTKIQQQNSNGRNYTDDLTIISIKINK
ncbi:MAG: fused response regulator/phosphatase [Spirochaetales bacterium]|nr:fused response regulator/phosphatase [Spirochaetales bacterium]